MTTEQQHMRDRDTPADSLLKATYETCRYPCRVTFKALGDAKKYARREEFIEHDMDFLEDRAIRWAIRAHS